MNWVILVLAGIFEVSWAVGLKYTEGFTRLVPSLLTALGLLISMTLLGIALRTLPLGTAYAIWTGIGTIGTVIAGVILFGDSMSPMRLACAGLIVVGILGLKFAS